ncbi:MAG: permease [Candidatus Omnitrophota bacterium]
MKAKSKFLLFLAGFAGFYFFPLKLLPFRNPVFESLALTKWYAREHVLLCLVPAFFIAGAVCIFISQEAVIKYLGAGAKKVLAYGVASVSGAILTVCSCTVLPLFSGIYKRGAGLGPAVTFLYAGPAINILAIILTAKVLGWQLGLARAVFAVVFSIIIGVLMHVIFLKEERARHVQAFETSSGNNGVLSKNIFYFAAMIGILVFANLSAPGQIDKGIWPWLFHFKWYIVTFFMSALFFILVKWFKKSELKDWVRSTWDFAQQILPLLLLGVIMAGFLLGRPGETGIIPAEVIRKLVGGNSLVANFFASVVGAFMYFATLTEIPILQGLIGSGMGKGPALALLLAGPALSLPNMLVVRGVIGMKKTLIYVALVIVMASVSGILFGVLVK